MIRAITLLTENFSDWETALINSTGRGYYGFDCRFATPGGALVTSSGGMLVSPHLAIEAIQLAEVDLLIVCGGASPRIIQLSLHQLIWDGASFLSFRSFKAAILWNTLYMQEALGYINTGVRSQTSSCRRFNMTTL